MFDVLMFLLIGGVFGLGGWVMLVVLLVFI